MASQVIPYNQNTQLQTGDVLVVDGIIPFINHYAIVYKKNGVQYVSEIDLERVFLALNLWKVITEPLADYEKRRTITGFVRDENTQALTDDYIQKKIIDCAPVGYQFLSYNCEDFIHNVCGCKLGYDKNQKWGYVIVIGIFVVLYFLFKNKNIPA